MLCQNVRKIAKKQYVANSSKQWRAKGGKFTSPKRKKETEKGRKRRGKWKKRENEEKRE